MSVSIKNLEQYGDRGWQWSVETTDWDETRVSRNYRTNRDGDGLWMVGATDDQQTRGTCQFNLPTSKNAARSKLYREFA